jgi:nucleotide-binding universal stress UspA family protein
MYHSLLVPLDGSDFGEHALAAAHGIARRAVCESPVALHLVQVHVPIVTAYVEGFPIVDEELDRAAREAEAAYLETVRAGFGDSPDIRIVTRVLDGNVAEALATYAADRHVDLIIMTTHGRGGLARAWLGSVADELVRRGGTPTLVLRPHDERLPDVAEQVFQRILVPLDGSSVSEAILRAVIPLAHLMHATVTLLRVVEPVSVADVSPHRYATRLSERLLQDMCSDVELYLKQVAARLFAEGIAVQTQVIVAAYPARAILNEAHLLAADLLAMTTRGRGGLARLLLGSTADKVVHAATIPVLLQCPHALAAPQDESRHADAALVA